ncbi:MAG TPA: SpoIIE family protein phosphatase [Solirubrobacteraceae bacterium]|nr:SpoIIE family protein phosphatase [Solirubrobacteraceae bacterium]
MSRDSELLADSAEELYEEAPCGYVTTLLDGTIVKVNRTFETWTGLRREDLVGRRRFQELLSPGGRIYHETHYAPLLHMQGSVREIAVDIVKANGQRLPALVNSVLKRDDSGSAGGIRTTVFDATDRRRYEEELLRAGRREREIAQELQLSMLAGTPPVSPELILEFHYSPAVRGTDVGGDWYDAFWLDPPHLVGLVVGDVVGRGIAAAATMGQLRSAVRALASTGLGPAALLSTLDVYARRHAVGLMTTLVYAELSLDTGGLRFACAGHPPPLLHPPGGTPVLDWGGRSTPVAVGPGPDGRGEQSLCLEPGTTLLLYTDGLVEDRRRPEDDGLQRLLREVAAVGAQDDLGQTVQSIVARMVDPAQSDDVCVLVAQLGPVAAR